MFFCQCLDSPVLLAFVVIYDKSMPKADPLVNVWIDKRGGFATSGLTDSTAMGKVLRNNHRTFWRRILSMIV